MRPASPRPHWSYSSLAQYLRCPLQYYFERVARLPRPGPTPAMFLGSMIHEALADHHRLQMTKTAQSPPKVRDDFITRWNAAIDENNLSEQNNLLETGVGLIEAYLEEGTVQGIIAVEQPLWVPLVDSAGEVLEKPLLVVPDLISSSGVQTVTVHEIKTAARAYSEADVAASLQATSYAHAIHETHAVSPIVEFVVLVKTKTPKVQRIHAHRDESDFGRLGDIANSVERGITSGVFYPVETPMNCSGCPYFRPCREWIPSRLASAEIDLQREVSAC